MDKPPPCKHYRARNTMMPESCSNCARGFGLPCIEFLDADKRYKNEWKLRELERLISERKAVFIPPV